MKIHCISTILSLTLLSETGAFAPSLSSVKSMNGISDSFTKLYGMNRKARRNLKKEVQGNSAPNKLKDAVEDIADDGKKREDVVSGASMSDASTDGKRPSVSTIVVDEATGIERIQQGQYVMDVITRKAVKLSPLGPMYRLAQMFPGVPPEIRAKHRLDWNTVEVPEMIEKLRQACMIPVKDETTGAETMDIPPHPRVSDEALDFVLANRDLLGTRMKKTLGRLKMKAQSEMDKEGAIAYRKLWKHFMTVEDSLSAPFKQMLMDAEGRIGPNFGNLDLMSFCGGELYERTANYLVLKGMVAHWEKKVRDAEYFENTPETRSNFIDILMVGDPKRYLPDPPIIFRYSETVRIALMAQNMTAQFVSTPELFDDLPAEVRFVEAASSIKGGTALRQYMIQDFCPAEGITPEALREGLRRLDVQMCNMQIDPYGDLKNIIHRLTEAVSVGSPDERDPYIPYLYCLEKDGPGVFQTYTFNHDRQSLVRFMDGAKEIQQGGIGPTGNLMDQLSKEASNLFGLSPKVEDQSKVYNPKTQEYKPPEKRACGRPHNVGWLDLLGDEEMTGGMKDTTEDEVYESDNWREIISKRQRITK